MKTMTMDTMKSAHTHFDNNVDVIFGKMHLTPRLKYILKAVDTPYERTPFIETEIQ